MPQTNFSDVPFGYITDFGGEMDIKIHSRVHVSVDQEAHDRLHAIARGLHRPIGLTAAALVVVGQAAPSMHTSVMTTLHSEGRVRAHRGRLCAMWMPGDHRVIIHEIPAHAVTDARHAVASLAAVIPGVRSTAAITAPPAVLVMLTAGLAASRGDSRLLDEAIDVLCTYRSRREHRADDGTGDAMAA